MKINHPIFDNHWISVFKKGEEVNVNKIRGEISNLGINSDTQRAGIRQCLGNGIPSDIRKPSFESWMAAIKIEIHILKFKSNPTGMIRR